MVGVRHCLECVNLNLPKRALKGLLEPMRMKFATKLIGHVVMGNSIRPMTGTLSLLNPNTTASESLMTLTHFFKCFVVENLY
ncbi:hypothetical protein FRX31_014395 [Thalictrum thalictroides]|uniref:Uncharacterized protein n=1 Tax=Thalictrum thalictroides TaxID=46969 RepID=A0A7J6WF71_THATH|nr:hypothetical protein FRX31_014395 [Thalictrum thalictroides]